jgi:predicted N-formylglutamate amidohydrolase
MTTPSADPPLIGSGEPSAVEIFHGEGRAPVLITCDHASRAVPRALEGLGLDPELLAQHIGWDIGAAEVTRRLAVLLDAPAVLAGYSRLVVDCNRDPGDLTSMPEMSDGVTVPGNRGLSAAARAHRLAALFTPYHAAIEAALNAYAGRGVAPAVLSIHSFTPTMNGIARPWQVGILWDEDGRIAAPLIAGLRADPSLAVGDNEPYSAREPVGYTMRHHAVRRGLPHVAVELRQDLIAESPGAAAWAARLAGALRPILADRSLYRAGLQ